MIYLIWWSPRSGKTTLSKKLSQELSIPYISTDYLRLVVIPYFQWDDKKENFPFEEMFEKYNNVEIFYKNSKGKDILNADIKEAHTLWKGIMGFIQHLLLSKTDYIIEWVHFLPELVNTFKNNTEVKIVILIKEDEQKIFDGLIENRWSGDWIADNIKDDTVLRSTAKSLSEYGKYFNEEWEKYWIHIINTEESFQSKISIAWDYLKI